MPGNAGLTGQCVVRPLEELQQHIFIISQVHLRKKKKKAGEEKGKTLPLLCSSFDERTLFNSCCGFTAVTGELLYAILPQFPPAALMVQDQLTQLTLFVPLVELEIKKKNTRKISTDS